MKYVTLVLYLFSYTTGFANGGFNLVAWLKSKERPYLLFCAFLAFFTAKMVVYNAEFFLEGILGWPAIRGTSLNLLLVSASATGFNVFLLLFLKSLTVKPWSRPLTVSAWLLSLNPLIVVTLSPWLGSALTDLGVETLLDSLLLALFTVLLFFRRSDARSRYWAQVMGVMATLNLIYFPLAVAKGFSDSWFHYDPNWFQLANGYYFVGNLWLGWLVVRHQFLPGIPPRQQSLNRLAEFGITLREADVVTLLGRGLSNRDIADRLHISPGTVKNHIYNVYQKTGAATRIELLNLLRHENVNNGT